MRPGIVASGVLAGVVLLAIGGTAGILLMDEPTPAVLSGPDGSADFQVTSREFADERRLTFTPSSSEGLAISSPAQGVITDVTCEPGLDFASGDELFRVNDSPVFGLNTEIPLYRDLFVNDQGADVAALNKELARLGYRAGSSDRYNWETRDGIRAFFADADVRRQDGSLFLTDVIWMQEPSLALTECKVEVGDTFAGGEVASTSGGVDKVTMAQAPIGVTPGERVILVGDEVFDVDDEGNVSPEGVAAIAETPEYRYWVQSEGQFDLQFMWSLKEPLQVTLVPPSALYGITETSGCVRTADGGVPATIIASQLGQSFVTFDEGVTPPTMVVTSRVAGETC